MANANYLIPHVASLGINGLNGSDSTNGLNGFDSSSSPPNDCWLSDQSKVNPTHLLTSLSQYTDPASSSSSKPSASRP
jgi:hypothetical protein